MQELTLRQQEILLWIRQYMADHGIPPTRLALCAAMGFRSPNAAESHLRALERKGAIELVQGVSRGIRLVEEPKEASGLPLIGKVAAGQPILAVAHIESYEPIAPELFRPVAHYLLRVQGESMRNAGILEGDLVAVHHTLIAQNGQIVVARLEDEVTIKRFYRQGERVELHPDNPDYPVIEVNLKKRALHIEGVMVGLIRA